MNSIRDELISLDTNESIFALRKDATHPACETLLFDKLDELKIHLPLQILLELQHNLTDFRRDAAIVGLRFTGDWIFQLVRTSPSDLEYRF